MADDKNHDRSESDLPEPDESPFFGSPDSDDDSPSEPVVEPPVEPEPEEPAAAEEPEPSAADTAEEPELAPEPEPADAVDAAEPAEEPFAQEVEPAESYEDDDLGSTNPYTPIFEPYDPAVAQPTELLTPVEPEPIPPYDPQAAQETQLVPVVPGEIESAAGVIPEPESPLLAPTVPTVTAGSRVVIVVSRGVPEVPPASMVGVPHVIGMSQGEALSQLQQAGLSAQVFNEYSDLPRGEVVGQLPAYGQSAPGGSEAVLLVSAGPAPESTLRVPLPDVVGLSEADALAKLQSAGLSPQIVRDFSANIPLGIVIEQLPNGHAIAEAPKKRGGGSLWWLWALLALSLLFAISGAAYYWMNRTGSVPNLVGLSQAQAEQAVTAAGFRLGTLTTTQTVSATDIGRVVSQSPRPYTQMKLVDRVDLVVSGGQKLFPVPDVTGQMEATARSLLTSAGLQVTVTQSYDATVPKGAVILQSPAAGEKVPSGTTIGLTISLGVQSVPVPGVVSQTRTQAVASLKAAGLNSQVVVDYWIGGIKDAVVAQYPTAGLIVTPGTIVGLIVSKGDPPSSLGTATVSVPTVVGKKQKDAQKLLSDQNLSNTLINQGGTGRPAGEVVGQVPEAGTQILRKSTVIVLVSNGR